MELQCALASSPVLRRRSTIALMVATAFALPLAGSHAGADSDDQAAERAAAEIAATRERANDAAAAYFDALSELDQLEDESKRLAADAVKLERQVDALRDQVEQVAVNRFVSSGNAGIPLLSGVREPSERLQAEVLVAVVTDSSAEAMDEFERASLELEANQHAVEENQEAVAEQKEEFLALQEQAEAEVVHLQEVEAATARGRARPRGARGSPARGAAPARVGGGAAAPGGRRAGRGGRRDRVHRRSVRARAGAGSRRRRRPSDRRRIAAAGRRRPDDDGDDPLPAAPEPDPEPEPEPSPPSGGIVCPVAGASSYSDTYGASRSGGRSHEGVDMLAPSGTPLVAVVSGSAEFGSSPLGGNSLWLHGSDGNAYFYAHLSGFEGSSRSVVPGRGDRLRREHRQRQWHQPPPLRGAPRRRLLRQPLPLRRQRRLLGPSIATAAASCPQAASMSVPRLRRTVAFTPSVRSRSRNSATRAGGDPRVGQPGVGLSGIRLTWAAGRSRRQSAGQLGGVGRPIVDAVDERPLEAHPSRLAARKSAHAASSASSG